MPTLVLQRHPPFVLSLALALVLQPALALAAERPGARPAAPPAALPPAALPPAALPPVSARQPQLDPPLRAARRFLLERARERYEAAELPGADARAELERALDALGLVRSIDPGPWLSFNLAQVYVRLGDCARARELYQQIVDAKLGGELQADAEQALAVLGECEARAADGSHPQPLSAEQELEPSLRLPASWRLAAELPLASVQLPAATAAAAPQHEPPRGWASAHIWPLALGSLATVGGTVAASYWWKAASLKEELRAVREAGPEVPRLQRRGRSAQNTALVWSGLSLGFALGAAGSYLWLRRAEQSAPADVSGLSWWGGTSGGGVMYHARF